MVNVLKRTHIDLSNLEYRCTATFGNTQKEDSPDKDTTILSMATPLQGEAIFSISCICIYIYKSVYLYKTQIPNLSHRILHKIFNY